MSSKISRKLKVFLVLAVLVSFAGFSVAAQTVCDNGVDQQGGYTYEYWKDNGSGCMVLGAGGTFSIEWSGINNLLARKGLRPGSMKQVVEYAADYRPNGNSYLCIYGWTKNPLVEYYIVDSWGSWRPPGGEGYITTIQSDGGSYDIYRTQRVNQPSIEGNTTFYQFWSVRKDKRTSGTINCANHFNAWNSNGLRMGSLYEVSFCVEGYQSSGSADVYQMSMSEGPGGTTPTPPVPTPTPDPNANISLRARGIQGGEKLEVKAGGSTVATFTLTTSYQTFTTSGNGGIEVHYINDDGVDNGMDAQLDYIIYNGVTYQAEDQAVNTGVWQDDSCGGSYSEMMHCSGYIRFDGTGPVVTPTPTHHEETPTPRPGQGDVFFASSNISGKMGTTLAVPVYVNSGDQELAAYTISIDYNPSALKIDTSKGTDYPGVTVGTDGFISAINDLNGDIKISGFDTSGKGTGPGNQLHLLTLYFTPQAERTSQLSISVDEMTDASYKPIGNPNGKTASVTIGPSGPNDILGDVSGDGKITIQDALMAAQYAVGLNPPGYNAAVGDVNCDGKYTIVDALLIAQVSVGSGTFPC